MWKIWQRRHAQHAQGLILGTVCLCSVHAFAQGTLAQTRAPDAPAQQLRRDLETMKEQMRQMQEKSSNRKKRSRNSVPRRLPLCLPPAPVPAPPTTRDREQLKQEVRESLRDIQPQLSAAKKTFPSQFNPAISLAIDTMFAYRQHEGNNFEFRSAELGLSASPIPLCVAMRSSTDLRRLRGRRSRDCHHLLTL